MAGFNSASQDQSFFQRLQERRAAAANGEATPQRRTTGFWGDMVDRISNGVEKIVEREQKTREALELQPPTPPEASRSEDYAAARRAGDRQRRRSTTLLASPKMQGPNVNLRPKTLLGY